MLVMMPNYPGGFILKIIHGSVNLKEFRIQICRFMGNLGFFDEF